MTEKHAMSKIIGRKKEFLTLQERQKDVIENVEMEQRGDLQ